MLDDCLMVMLSDRESELLGLAAQLAKLQPLSSPNNMIGIQNLRNRQDLNFEHPSNSGRGSDDWKSWEQLLKRPQPPEGYVCFNCYQPGHFIQHCTKVMLRFLLIVRQRCSPVQYDTAVWLAHLCLQ